MFGAVFHLAGPCRPLDCVFHMLQFRHTSVGVNDNLVLPVPTELATLVQDTVGFVGGFL